MNTRDIQMRHLLRIFNTILNLPCEMYFQESEKTGNATFEAQEINTLQNNKNNRKARHHILVVPRLDLRDIILICPSLECHIDL